MTYFQAVILGIVQGITEFFPVSSSGHLVLVQKVLGIHENIFTFDIFVHFGTLLAVVKVFRNPIIKIIRGCYAGLKSLVMDKTPARMVYRNSREIRLALGIVLGTFPAVVVGFTLNDFIEGLFQSEVSVYISLFITGCVLLCTFFTRKNNCGIGIFNGFIVGIAQAVAIIPGISRSGLTISTALFSGVKREEAGEFSFLLSIPVILGATILAVNDYFGAEYSTLRWDVAVLGTVVSFVSGWISLVFLMRIIRRGKIGYFGFYCIAVALFGGAFTLF